MNVTESDALKVEALLANNVASDIRGCFCWCCGAYTPEYREIPDFGGPIEALRALDHHEGCEVAWALALIDESRKKEDA